jgi:hypothetical protein
MVLGPICSKSLGSVPKCFFKLIFESEMFEQNTTKDAGEFFSYLVNNVLVLSMVLSI